MANNIANCPGNQLGNKDPIIYRINRIIINNNSIIPCAVCIVFSVLPKKKRERKRERERENYLRYILCDLGMV